MTRPDIKFAGTIPAAYDRYLGPMFFEPYAADLAARVARLAPRRVLETACGTGILTAQLCRVLSPSGELVATDLSQGMLQLTQKRSGSDPRVTCRVADAAELPFEDGSFDLVISQFGVMFIPDKAKAMAEARRVLRRGGHLLFNVWDGFDANPLGRLPHELISEMFPVDTPGFYRIPFSMHDRDEIQLLVQGAGFQRVSIEDVAREASSPSATDAATGLITGTPAFTALQERGVQDVAPVIARLAAAFEKAGGRAPLRLPMQAIVISAQC